MFAGGLTRVSRQLGSLGTEERVALNGCTACYEFLLLGCFSFEAPD